MVSRHMPKPCGFQSSCLFSASCPPRCPVYNGQVSSLISGHPEALISPFPGLSQKHLLTGSWHPMWHMEIGIGHVKSAQSMPWPAKLSAMTLFLTVTWWASSNGNRFLTGCVFSLLTELVLLKLAVIKDQFFPFPSANDWYFKKIQ